ncbi:MAG: haloacid dehalogenase, partial [Bacillota bacterium]|nr:haloacid dehalogenase [Bacillota bacterium]
MLKVSLPGRGRQLELKKLLLDLNGTLTVDGILENGVKQRIEDIKKNFEVYLLTADTRGSGSQVAEELGIQLFKVSGDHGNQDKLDFLNTVGAEETVMIGNGFNDSLVLEQAALSIAVIG